MALLAAGGLRPALRRSPRWPNSIASVQRLPLTPLAPHGAIRSVAARAPHPPDSRTGARVAARERARRPCPAHGRTWRKATPLPEGWNRAPSIFPSRTGPRLAALPPRTSDGKPAIGTGGAGTSRQTSKLAEGPKPREGRLSAAAGTFPPERTPASSALSAEWRGPYGQGPETCVALTVAAPSTSSWACRPAPPLPRLETRAAPPPRREEKPPTGDAAWMVAPGPAPINRSTPSMGALRARFLPRRVPLSAPSPPPLQRAVGETSHGGKRTRSSQGKARGRAS